MRTHEGRVTAGGYESRCSRSYPEKLLAERRWLSPRFATHPKSATVAAEADRSRAARAIACADGIQQCGYCARMQDSRAYKAVMESVSGQPCTYCGVGDEIRSTADHVLAQSKGGAHEPQNMVPACLYCNSSKNKTPVAEWLASDAPKAVLARLHRKMPRGQLALPITALPGYRTRNRIVLVTEAERRAERFRSRILSEESHLRRYPNDYRTRDTIARLTAALATEVAA